MLRLLKNATKMVLPHRIPTVYTVILLLLLQASLEAKKPKRRTCPIGFKLAYTRTTAEPICYRLKGPEKFTDTFKECSGNLYTAKLYDSLNVTDLTEQVLWTEYKSAYPRGPFVDTSFTSTTGYLLETSFDVTNAQLTSDEELCVVKDPVGNYTADSCHKEYYRYCCVEPYPEEILSTEGCDRLKGSWRFWAPRPICLTAATAVGGGTVRATWSQSNEICEKRGGEILYSGWRYSNHPMLHVSDAHTMYPLRVTYDPSRNTTVKNGFVRQLPATMPDEQTVTDEVSFGALRNGIWDLVNSSYIFYDVICEKDVDIKPVTLTVRADEQNKLILTVDGNVNESNIYCFTDSETYYPKPVKISLDEMYNTILSYVLKPESDGYYWCVNIDSKRFQVSESNKLLWIREEQSLKYTYAVKLYFNKEYTFDTVDKISKIWEKKLKDYIFYSTNYYNVSGYLDRNKEPEAFQDTLKDFKESHPELTPKEKAIIYGMKIKKINLDGKTALVHFQLYPTMTPVQPGWWSNMKILYMKPVYYCSVAGQEFVNKIKIGCVVHSCIGNFNDGVQVLSEGDQNCTTFTEPTLYNAQVTVRMPTFGTLAPGNNNTREDMTRDKSISSEETQEVTTGITESTTRITATTYKARSTQISTDIPPSTYKPEPPVTALPPVISSLETVITVIPTFPTTIPAVTTEMPTTPRPPKEQLQLVMDDLENLVNNQTAQVSVDSIAGSFDKVDELLEEAVSLEIPGELLHLLDQIGKRLELNGSDNAQAIRPNVALLVASAEPGLPVNGLRIAARSKDVFTDEAFEILRDDINSNHLSAESSEAVVHLPNSVANSSRRISFVVFRNDRAFQTNSSLMSVNSRVLSINVENITQFRSGESIDIHFSPLIGDIDRNQSRTCAFWQFDDNGGGEWSQDGCKFIAATESGMLDTCRCEHLTHFAEILVSRTLFSELNETILEYLSIIGCCLSIFGLTMIGITAALFRSWRRDFNNKIWLQLCISILLLVTCFLIAVFANFSSDNVICMLTGIALHYSVLASFCWMLVAAVLSYRRLVMVFTRDASHKLLRASAFAWGVPFAIVGILLSVNPQSYSGQFEDKTPTGAFCYPSGLGLWLAVYAPIGIMLLANWTLFVLIVRSVFASTRIPRHGDSNEALRCASVSCLLVFLFGLPWLFGLFAYNVVAAYFFALTATFQGFVLFVFFVLGNKKTRDLWLNKLKIKQTRKVPVTSSTYTNRSTGGGPGWRGGASGSVEAKVSKPRSLASADDSRFS